MRRPLRDRQVRRRQLPRHPRHPRGGTILSRRQKNRPKRPARLRPPVRGFPCQAFSNAGRRKGFEDARGTLFFEIARLAQARRPAYLLLENVPGLLTHDQGRTFSAILATLNDLGYRVEWMVLNSADFRVPRSESGCSLSDILIPDAPEKYFLSSEQTEKLLYKSSAGRRDRESMTPEGPPVHRLPEVEEKE